MEQKDLDLWVNSSGKTMDMKKKQKDKDKRIFTIVSQYSSYSGWLTFFTALVPVLKILSSIYFEQYILL